MRRRHAYDFLEQAGEVRGVLVPQFVADLADRHRREKQQPTRLLQLQLNEIVDRGIAGLLFEQAREMRGRQVGVPCHVGEGQELMNIVMQVGDCRVEVVEPAGLQGR